MAMDVTGNGAGDVLAQLLAEAVRIVAFTGAGISTESGIPDFRSPGGIWSRMAPITYQEFVGSEAARLEDWRRRFVMNAEFARAEPNAGHRALALLLAEGRDLNVVTQNIDGLHQRSGVPPARLVELHGNATYGRCLECGARRELEDVRAEIDATGRAPRCPACGGLVKAAVISFGEAMPQAAMERAVRLAESADLLIVLGSSLVVHPAAMIPVVARESGADLVIVNRDPTPLDGVATLVLREAIGPVFLRLFPQLGEK
ncbi:NAD-dependent deacetylase [Rhizobiales bacterium L72]|uniref:protein acetyllysine N-acetyltransferase n=2 Tax=Propylenella binzhouense TaxID=2555902 RepID=A0A964T4D4_9HYPH|nr:NAD-dependent deacetylase [Propylenella binzhouense]